MFAQKSSYPTSNVHLPPIGKTFRQRIRPPPTPSFSSRAAKAAHIAENVTALKAKYNDYTTWLKASPRSQRQPQVAQDLLKNSLCQMGIDSVQADKLVSKCSWYVYQFERGLKDNPMQKEQIILQSKQCKNKKKKNKPWKSTVETSTITISTCDQDQSFLSNSISNHVILPQIHVTDSPSPASRLRKVDFDHEQTQNKNLQSSSLHWRTAMNKTRLKPLGSSNTSVDLDSSLTSQNLHRLGRTRSILRKQDSTSSMNTANDLSQRKTHSRLVTPSSTTVIDHVPLGTRSQRLFGGSECFAQIMNELEQQKKGF